jgi:hypothetical protein
MILLACALLCAGRVTLAQQPTAEVRTLELGKPIERELAAKAVHVYQIALTNGQVLHAVVDQRGIDVTCS